MAEYLNNETNYYGQQIIIKDDNTPKLHGNSFKINYLGSERTSEDIGTVSIVENRDTVDFKFRIL